MEPELYIFLTAVVGLATSVVILGGMVWRVRQDIKGVGNNVIEGRREVDGRMDELLELTRKTAHAAGVKEGQEEK